MKKPKKKNTKLKEKTEVKAAQKPLTKKKSRKKATTSQKRSDGKSNTGIKTQPPEKSQKSPSTETSLLSEPHIPELQSFIQADNLVALKGRTRSEALAELCEQAGKMTSLISASDILKTVLESESQVNTKIGENWAIPHARVPGLSEKLILVVGRSIQGVAYDNENQEQPPVQLIFLLLAREDASYLYLQTLAKIIQILRNPQKVSRLIRAGNVKTFCSVLSNKGFGRKVTISSKLPSVTRHLIRNMLRFADDISVNSVFFHIDTFQEPTVLKSVINGQSFLVSAEKEIPQVLIERAGGVVRLPFQTDSLTTSMRLSLLLALNRNLIGQDERVLSLAGIPHSNTLDIMRLFEMKEFPILSLQAWQEEEIISAGVVERVIELASIIAHQGREGSPIGTAFIVGSKRDLIPMTRQLTINPFFGYEARRLNILDPTLEETIKEFSALDGCFIINPLGELVSAGSYLASSSEVEVELPSGLGARHRAAAMMTAAAPCVAVVVSASTGTVSVYVNGKLALALEDGRERRISSILPGA